MSYTGNFCYQIAWLLAGWFFFRTAAAALILPSLERSLDL
jgi:hypothetical protein